MGGRTGVDEHLLSSGRCMAAPPGNTLSRRGPAPFLLYGIPNRLDAIPAPVAGLEGVGAVGTAPGALVCARNLDHFPAHADARNSGRMKEAGDTGMKRLPILVFSLVLPP